MDTAMTAPAQLRRLPTAFDLDDSPITLATPSCCCCCCCCIATVVTAIVHDTRDGYVKGKAAEEPALGATVGFLALPMAGLIAFGIGTQSDFAGGPVVWLAVMAALYIGLVVAVHRIGDISGGVVSGVVRAIVIGIAFTLELGAVIATGGFVWLLIPFFIWGGWSLASRQ